YTGTGSEIDVPSALGVSPDGSTVFITGVSAEALTGYDYATVAYDASSGVTRWAARYSHVSSFQTEGASALGLSPDGSTVFVTGRSDYDYATVAYDASTGASLWVARYGYPAEFNNLAFALGVSPDGSTVFVTGGSSYDYATVA